MEPFKVNKSILRDDHMALYYEAAQLLTTVSDNGGSFKSRIYNSADLKSNPSHLFALISEASKWSPVLKEVIERSGILPLERKVRFTVQSAILRQRTD